MSNYTPVEGQKGLYRDNDTAAIVNRDKNAYKSYMARKKTLESKDCLLYTSPSPRDRG